MTFIPSRNSVINAICDAVSVHHPNVLIHAHRYDTNRPVGVCHSLYTQYACPSAAGMLLVNSPSDTATQRLHAVTRTRPQRMVMGPPLLSPLLRSCAKVEYVPTQH
jgi:hypothetical protein